MNPTYPFSAEDVEALQAEIERVIDSYNERFQGIADVKYDPEDVSFTVNMDFSNSWFTIDPEIDGLGNTTGKWAVTVWTPVPSENAASEIVIGSNYPDVFAASVAICQAYHDTRIGEWRMDISTPEEAP